VVKIRTAVTERAALEGANPRGGRSIASIAAS
jgi:hypothetical protein